jgi:hypothetical protein
MWWIRRLDTPMRGQPQRKKRETVEVNGLLGWDFRRGQVLTLMRIRLATTGQRLPASTMTIAAFSLVGDPTGSDAKASRPHR